MASTCLYRPSFDSAWHPSQVVARQEPRVPAWLPKSVVSGQKCPGRLDYVHSQARVLLLLLLLLGQSLRQRVLGHIYAPGTSWLYVVADESHFNVSKHCQSRGGQLGSTHKQGYNKLHRCRSCTSMLSPISGRIVSHKVHSPLIVPQTLYPLDRTRFGMCRRRRGR